MIRVRFLGYFIEHVGRNEITVEVPKARVKDILPKTILSLAEEEAIILVNGVSADMDTVVMEGDEVVVMPPIGGG